MPISAAKCNESLLVFIKLPINKLLLHHTIPHSHGESFGLTTVVLASHERGNGAHGNLEYLTNWMGYIIIKAPSPRKLLLAVNSPHPQAPPLDFSQPIISSTPDLTSSCIFLVA